MTRLEQRIIDGIEGARGAFYAGDETARSIAIAEAAIATMPPAAQIRRWHGPDSAIYSAIWAVHSALRAAEDVARTAQRRARFAREDAAVAQHAAERAERAERSHGVRGAAFLRTRRQATSAREAWWAWERAHDDALRMEVWAREAARNLTRWRCLAAMYSA